MQAGRKTRNRKMKYTRELILITAYLLEQKKTADIKHITKFGLSQTATLHGFREHQKSSCRCFVADVILWLLSLPFVQIVVYSFAVVAAFAACAASGDGGIAVVVLIVGLHLQKPNEA